VFTRSPKNRSNMDNFSHEHKTKQRSPIQNLTTFDHCEDAEVDIASVFKESFILVRVSSEKKLSKRLV